MAKPEDFKSWSAGQVRDKLVELGMPKSRAEALKPKSVAVKALCERLGNGEETKTAAKIAEPEPAADDSAPDFDDIAKDATIDERELNLEVFGPDADFEAVPVEKEELQYPERKPTPKRVQNTVIAAMPDSSPILSAEWTPFVMSQFVEDELSDGNPTVDGLRRVAQKLLGPIVAARSKIVESPRRDNFFSAASVEYELTILWIRDDLGPEGPRTFCGVADCSRDNTPAPYHKHATATAETKAEGRALRKALMLRKVLASEEIVVETTDAEELGRKWDPDARITNEQKVGLDTLCKLKNINVLKLINIGKQKHADIDEVRFSTATEMLEYLNEVMNGRKEIPPKVIGYDPSWAKGNMS